MCTRCSPGVQTAILQHVMAGNTSFWRLEGVDWVDSMNTCAHIAYRVDGNCGGGRDIGFGLVYVPTELDV
eukprot:587614-Prymnesium_polylepis.1